MKKTNEIIKSYELVHKANEVKLDGLFQLYSIYTKEYKHHLHRYWKLFLSNKVKHNSFSHQGSTKHIQTKLNASYLQVCLSQACASLNRYLSQLEQKFKLFLDKSSIKDKDLLHQLRTINSTHAWLNQEAHYYPTYQYHVVDDFGNLIKTYTKKIEIKINPDVLRLSRKIFKHILRLRVRFPQSNKPRLLIDTRLYTLDKSKSPSFDYWLKISTLAKGKRISIPIKSNDFFNQSTGQLGKTIELSFNHFDYDKVFHHYQSLSKPKHPKPKNSLKKKGLLKTNRELKIIFNKQHTLEEYSQCILKDKPIAKVIKDRVVAFDIGLCNFLATSDGELIGRYWLDKLTIYDKQLTQLSAYRQSRGVKTRSKRYDNLVQRVRGFIKTETNRILNDYFDQHQDIKTVVIEKLVFNNPNLSKRLNRIVKNFGLAIFNNKLKDLSLIYGFTIAQLNPAYTSQDCIKCGYIDKNNRSTQAKFKCLCCGYQCHADIHSARVNLKRFRTHESVYETVNRGMVLRKLKLDFINNIQALLSNGQTGRRNLYTLLLKNNYFNREIKEIARTAQEQRLTPMTVRNFESILNLINS